MQCWNALLSKIVNIDKTPKVLILNFDWYNRENFTHHLDPVKFKHRIDIAEYCVSTNENETTYYLYGVIEHSGMVSQSNFICFFRDFTVEESWFKYLGEGRVIWTNSIEMRENSKVYILFYLRKDVITWLKIIQSHAL